MECIVNGGSGKYSYSKNSKIQRNAIEDSKELIKKGISEKLNIDSVLSSQTFRIADLGCAAGPNTFIAVQNIVDTVERKCKSQNRLVEFQVFFNDQAKNDFNQLFISLPPERRYFASGAPGSFHGRLFPSGSLHFVHSSYSVQILSRLPEEVLDKNSPAWNKGRIHYSSSSTNEVAQAYRAQYAKDMETFFKARAQEIVTGGLMALIVPAWPEGTPYSESLLYKASEILGSCLVDLADKGRIMHEKLDSLNLPTYFASPEEMEEAVKRNGSFGIELMTYLPQQNPQPKELASTMTSGMSAILKGHLGEDISEELFDTISAKFEQNYHIFESENSGSLFVLLKRVATQ